MRSAANSRPPPPPRAVDLDYLADVYVLEDHRGRGLGRWLVDVVLQHEDLQTLRRLRRSRGTHMVVLASYVEEHGDNGDTMPSMILDRPGPGDHPDYFARYIALIPTGNLLDIMNAQISALRALLGGLDDSQAGHAYAPGKWTIREVVGHLIDTERVFFYRATAFSRADPQPLPSFDQATWLPLGEYDSRRLDDVLDEWADTRRSTLALLRSMPTEALARRGVASGNEITVLSCMSILSGHLVYHTRQLHEHYGIGDGQIGG